VAGKGITRGRLLAAAGTLLAAPGCFGGSSAAPPPETARPRAARLTGPLRGLAPAGAQIEYERRCSSPSMRRRSVRDWPALKS